MTGKLLDSPLSSIFGGPQSRVLELLLTVDSLLSVRDIARQTEMSPSTASTALVALKNQGVITRQVVGSTHLYKISNNYFLMPNLRKIIEVADDLDNKTVNYLRQRLQSVGAIVLYGSHARKTSTPSSDIDLLIVHLTSRSQQQAEELRHEIRVYLTRFIGREVSITSVIAPTLKESKTPFWRNISREGICLFGNLPAHISLPKTQLRGSRGKNQSKETPAKSR